ncbi:FkbM family methyltransferase [Catalinimonas niigatensis]|uniref:FkbM family methyltransferase n=1 Tax=Catalinimonas niigatensis TaxID=1397264 RepID=UPI002666207D|nr:FkbM family methyltransferase [Catalinimonas niigatensis]WPP52547.1 FkbM family methyltransferase [Catalinimonas niigatensis]
MQSSKNKFTRYKNLVKYITNWKSYLLFKIYSKDECFIFKLNNSFSVKVPRTMLSAFKESFLDDIYLRGFPKEIFKEESMTVIDIGANAGFFSLYTFYHFPSSKVFAYEPMPYNFSVLKQYQMKYSDFEFNIHQKAIGAKEGKITLNASKLDGYTTMASVFEKDYNTHQIEVECVTLAQIMAHNHLHTVDLLKLDCEGAEYEILYNTSNHDLHKIQLMCIETHLGTGARENTSALEKFLKERNFKVDTLDEGKTGYLWAWKE